MKILIADDSRVMRRIVIRTLRQAGYDDHDIVEAADGREAYDKVHTEEPDLVLSDWDMPRMSGLECLRALRSAGSAVPFGFVTAESSPDMREQAAEAGALFLVSKPFTEETFRDALDAVWSPHGNSGVLSARCPRAAAADHGREGQGTTPLLPAAKEVRDLFSGLLGRPVTVRPGVPVTPAEDRPVSLAVYVDPYLAVTALCVMDPDLSAYAGGALALLPPGGIRDAVEEGGGLPAVLAEALYEMVDVLSALLNPPGARHSKLYKLYLPGQELPTDLATMAAAFHRLDLDVEVPGYGSGPLSLVLPA